MARAWHASKHNYINSKSTFFETYIHAASVTSWRTHGRFLREIVEHLISGDDQIAFMTAYSKRNLFPKFFSFFYLKFETKGSSPVQNQQTRELISAWKTSHKHNEDLSRANSKSPGMRVKNKVHLHHRYILSSCFNPAKHFRIPQATAL